MSRGPCHHTQAPRHSLNSPSQGLRIPPGRVRLKEHVWTSLLNYVAAHSTLTRPLSHHFPLVPDSYLPPVVVQDTWPNAKKRKKFGRYSRINLAPFSRPQEDRAIMPSSSSNISATTRTTHQRPFGTLGRQSKPPYTIASLNNNSGRSPRDRFNHCLTHATPFYRLLFLASERPEPLLPLTTPAAPVHTRHSFASVYSQGQRHLPFLRSASVFRHVGSVTATGQYRHTGNTSPSRADTSHVHRVRTFSEARAEINTACDIREPKARLPRASLGGAE